MKTLEMGEDVQVQLSQNVYVRVNHEDIQDFARKLAAEETTGKRHYKKQIGGDTNRNLCLYCRAFIDGKWANGQPMGRNEAARRLAERLQMLLDHGSIDLLSKASVKWLDSVYSECNRKSDTQNRLLAVLDQIFLSEHVQQILEELK